MLHKIIYHIDDLFSKLAQGVIYLYQYTLSPDKGLPSLWLKGRICAHEPHCSQYSILCLQRYGFFASMGKIPQRVFSCTGSMQKIYDPEHYSVVFFSSAPIGVPFLEALQSDKRFEVTGVVTMPDAPSGRGMKMQENIIKTTAKKYHFDIQTPNSLRYESKKYADEAISFQQRLTTKKPDYIVVIAYGKIIPQAILDIPRIAPINVHGSILPKYRGASPIQSVFLDDEKETGITIMKMAAWLDTGDMVDIKKFPIPFERTAKDSITKMQDIWPHFLAETLWKYGKWLLWEVAQDEKKSTVCGKISKEDALIDPWKDSIESIYKKYRAYFLRPKIYFMYKGKRVIVEELVFDEQLFGQYKDQSLILPPWERGAGGDLHPAVTKCTVKPEGSKSQSWEDFVKGYM